MVFQCKQHLGITLFSEEINTADDILQLGRIIFVNVPKRNDDLGWLFLEKRAFTCFSFLSFVSILLLSVYCNVTCYIIIIYRAVLSLKSGATSHTVLDTVKVVSSF